MSKKKTHEEYVAEITIKNPNIKVIENYIDCVTKINHQCLIDGFIWPAKPNNILSGKGCPMCAKRYTSIKFKKTNDEYIKELNKIHPYIVPLEEYQGDSINIFHKCIICKYKWKPSPSNLLQGKGCPVCSGHVIGSAPSYQNSIWSSEYNPLFSQYMSDEQMKSIMPHSGQKYEMKCPHCGNIKQTSPANVVISGFSCMCGDGQSFPNKFVYNVLSQLNINIQPEYSPNWAGKLRYDDFLIDYNIIIENHGIQHYEECPLTNRSLEEEQANDMLKQKLAKDNGIIDYIIIDCRRPTADKIKDSIMSSCLPSILKFSENDIDWIQALQYAANNLVKLSADMYNDGLNIHSIAILLNKNTNTIRKWLKTAAQIGWCNYIPKEQAKGVYCIELDQNFSRLTLAAKSAHTSVASIINNLNGTYSYAGKNIETNEKLHWRLLNNN